MQNIELLAPAGSFEAARAAISAGADALYMGGAAFSARAYAESAGTEMLLETIRYAHLRGVKVYMTLNTLMKEREMDTLYEYLLPYYRAGVDAVIVQDLGVLRFVREHFPLLPVHASTQMTVTGRYYAALLKELGVSRVVTARELSAEEIRDIHTHVDVEIESFVHGALCYCCSGQCLMSSFLGGRSGNRGRCAGPCRLPYEVLDENGKKLSGRGGAYVLSMKDFDTHAALPELLSAGVMSLKIEGRMKSPLYVAAVTSVYRKRLDYLCGKGEKPREAEEAALLSAAFDRGGSTDGYLKRHNGADMIVWKEKAERRPEEALLSAVRERYLLRERKLPVTAEAFLEKGKPARLILSAEAGSVKARVCAESVYGDRSVRVEAASKQPLSEAKIRENLGKFGTTAFEPKQLLLHADADIFIPVREINELRRKAADELTEEILKRSGRDGGTGSGSA